MPTTTSTITLIVHSETPADVENYIRDAIDNADQEWDIESAQIETSDGVITDLLDDTDEDEPTDPEEATTQEEETTQQSETVTEQDILPVDDPRNEPTGNEF